MKLIDLSSDREGIFAGDDPFEIARAWLHAAQESEINDPNAVALASVDETGMPNARIVLLKEIAVDDFVFFTNYNSTKAGELLKTPKAAFVMHWKSLRRQIRVRGTVVKAKDSDSDAYFETRSVFSRVGAWASDQSAPLDCRKTLEQRAEKMTQDLGDNPARPPHWGGFRVIPLEIEFWRDGANRLHDRFKWYRNTAEEKWSVTRLNP